MKKAHGTEKSVDNDAQYYRGSQSRKRTGLSESTKASKRKIMTKKCQSKLRIKIQKGTWWEGECRAFGFLQH